MPPSISVADTEPYRVTTCLFQKEDYIESRTIGDPERASSVRNIVAGFQQRQFAQVPPYVQG
ncbi:unnamed protein product [Gongylonema pulchrum]|uniref:DUF1330 domain-containing protein n=1 Tax=Gongylonema pulchrum TaxID=637853 RepID=A0A183CZL3_9BILA|nr:unnamed protein product [Gongylonema pulchrum]